MRHCVHMRLSYQTLATVLLGSGAVANEIAGLRAQITSGMLAPSSWAELQTLTGSTDGAGAEIPLSDDGTHSEASATGYDGEAVNNHGRYKWSEDWSRWVRVAEYGGAVSDVFVTLDGTANALTGSTDRDHSKSPYATKFVSVVEQQNTGEVTIGIDGGTARALLTNSGAPLQPGELLPGMVIVWRWTGTDYRLVPGISTAAMVQRAEDAREGAETAQGVTETARNAALVSQTEAGISAATALTARAGAEAAASAAATARAQSELAALAAGAMPFATEEEGRSSSADGDVFLQVVGPGMRVWRRNDASSSTSLGWLGELIYDRMSDLVASTDDGFLPGQLVRTRLDGYTLEIADPGVENQDLENAASTPVKFYVTETPGRIFQATAFGVIPSATADNTVAWNRLWAAVARTIESIDNGGPVTVWLPRGVIRTSSTVTLPRGVAVIGQGAGKTIFGDSDGTIIVATGTQSIFYTGFQIDTDAGKCIGVELQGFSLMRDAVTVIETDAQGNDLTAATKPAETGLIHGHQAIEWRVTNVRMNGGYTPCVNFTNAWDCQWTRVTFTGGGVPDGTYCVSIRNSTGSSKNSNYQQFLQCRWEDVDGSMLLLEGLHNSVLQSKFHAISNHKGSVARPAIELPDSSVFIGNGIANNSGPEAALTCSVWIRLRNGQSIVKGNIFRNNAGTPVIEIFGTNVFAGGHIIADNIIDGITWPGIIDTRTDGIPVTLGSAEWAQYQGTPTGVPPTNLNCRVIAGGKPVYMEGKSYFEQSEDEKGPALHARYSLGYGAGVGDVAALIQSGSYQRPVAIVEQTRTTGNTSAELQIRTGKASTDGKPFLQCVSDTGGQTTGGTTRVEIGHDGTYKIEGVKVLGPQQAGIADDASGASNQATVNEIVAALRGMGIIAP